jgi:E3 ubiquitin-protein ligase DOA10
MEGNLRTCRICLIGKERPNDLLLTPCDCVGNQEFVHKSCLCKWLEMTGQEECERCEFKFIAKKNSKSFWDFVKEHSEDSNEFCEIFDRTINIICLALIGLTIWLSYQIGWFWWSLLFLVSSGRLFGIYRLWRLFLLKTYYNYVEWKRTHFNVRIWPNPNHIQE